MSKRSSVSCIVFQDITSIKKFADIPSYVLLKNKLPSRMIEHVLLHIKNIVIKYNQVFPICNSCLKVLHTHDLIHFPEWSFASPDYLVDYLYQDKKSKEHQNVQQP